MTDHKLFESLQMGDLELKDKYRFLKEVMAAVLEVWPSKRVGVRLSPNGVFNDMGSPDFRETFLYTIKELNKLNLAYVHIMSLWYTPGAEGYTDYKPYLQ
jgi:2,4-dienoyl-CoA reductase-like NADH-dependent reductase (Old Yellow Enzyme family)